ncbi:hypothetical protein JG688_00018416 [Phytophthora aleatoria]|uniref:Uncharacterized protein n=1 Tax=Phytophthora aleatoria TaxID=2496075 RepID=A0A8J5MB46_9STRA|nr:hypothetical protein JG688_00018416 [Phytophthora aleatoria]
MHAEKKAQDALKKRRRRPLRLPPRKLKLKPMLSKKQLLQKPRRRSELLQSATKRQRGQQ